MRELEEVGRTADAIRADLEAAFVRGLATSTPADRRGLTVRTEEWERVGAHHVATRLRAALRAADAGGKDVAVRFLSAYTSLHAFERVLSLEVARHAWAGYLAQGEAGEGEEAESRPEENSPPPVVMAPSAAPPSAAVALEDTEAAARLATDLAKLVEDLVRTGLTSATASTRTRLDAAFRDVSRQKLLRLGASLRYVNEEVGRFLADDGTFTARRYAFFLHRSWLLARGIVFALSKKDPRLTGALAHGAGSVPRAVGPLEVVTLGVNKRAAQTMCSFDFRLRVTKTNVPALAGKSLVYSLVFTRKPGVAADAYLHLPQPQKFVPKIFRDRTTLAITDAAVLIDDRGAGGRLVLGPKSTVSAGEPFEDWESVYGWDPRGAAARVGIHAPTPLDLAVEMQEEVVLETWTLGGSPEGDAAPYLAVPGLILALSLPGGEEGKDLRSQLAAASKTEERPRLFGTVHYEFGKVVFSPLSFLSAEGPDYLLLSDENVKLKDLLGSLELGK